MVGCGYVPVEIFSTYFFSDGNGAHTLTRVGSTLTWTATGTAAVTTYKPGPFLGAPCDPDGNTLTVFYSLAITGGMWQFAISWRVQGCSVGCVYWQDFITGDGSAVISVSATAADPCNGGPMVFSVPSSRSCFGGSSNTPGGGGGISVAP
jgi:hypothetical protein